MELVLITSGKKDDNEPQMVTQFFEAGLTTLHLRKPNFSTRQLITYIEAIPEHFRNRIIIHSHHELILKYNLKGIHFTEVHLTRKFAKWWFFRKLKASGKKIVMTRSYRKLSDVYNQEEIAFDYYLIGTIYNNITNEFYSGFYEQGVNTALTKTNKLFIARGGINEITIEKTFKYGFKGAALNSQIWKAEDPFKRFLDILEDCKRRGVVID